MAFCPSCGSPAGTGSAFCGQCGGALSTPPSGPLGAAPAAPYFAPPPAAPARGERPVGVTVVGVVLMAAALFTAFGALVVFAGSQWLAAYVPVAEGKALFSVLGPVIALLVLGFAALLAATGWGVLQGRNWAWVLVLVFLGLNALGGLGDLAQQNFEGVVAILVSGLVGWYFFRPEVRAWFGAERVPA